MDFFVYNPCSPIVFASLISDFSDDVDSYVIEYYYYRDYNYIWKKSSVGITDIFSNYICTRIRFVFIGFIAASQLVDCCNDNLHISAAKKYYFGF